MNPKIHSTKRGGAFAPVSELTALPKKLFVAALLALLATFALPQTAGAALMSQTDTNGLAAASTNTFVLFGSATEVSGAFTNGETPGGSAFIDCSKTTQAFGAVGGFFTNTAASSTNIIYRIAQSVDGVNWTNNAQVITLVVPALSTNWCVQQFNLTAPYPLYGLRAVENAAPAGIVAKPGTIYLKVWPKAGL